MSEMADAPPTDAEFLFVEDADDSPFRHPIEEIAPEASSLVATIASPHRDSRYRPSRTHLAFVLIGTAAEAPLWLSAHEEGDGPTDGVLTGTAGSGEGGSEDGGVATPSNTSTSAGGGANAVIGIGGSIGGREPDPSAPLASPPLSLSDLAQEIMHRRFSTWDAPVPLAYFRLPGSGVAWQPPDKQRIDLSQLEEKTFPVLVCFVNGKAKREGANYVEGVTYVQGVSSAAQARRFIDARIDATRALERQRMSEVGLVWAPMPPSEEDTEVAANATAALLLDAANPTQTVKVGSEGETASTVAVDMQPEDVDEDTIDADAHDGLEPGAVDKAMTAEGDGTASTWRRQLATWRAQLREAQLDACAGMDSHWWAPRGTERHALAGTAAWCWRSGAFAAMFAPTKLADCNLEGRPPLMKPHLYRFLACLEGTIKNQGALLTGHEVTLHHRLPAVKLLRVSKALELMGPMLEYEDLIEHARDVERFPAALRGLQHRILLMEHGESLVFRGGWHNQSDYSAEGVVGAVVHILERDRYNPNMFALVTCNSGSGWGTTIGGRPYESGIEYHEASSEFFPVPAARTAMRIKRIPRHRLHDEGFLALLLGQLALHRPENSARVLYDVLLPHLAGGTLDVAMAEAEREHGPLEEIFHKTHAHYLPLVSCLNYLLSRTDEMGEPGLNAAQRSQVLLAMRFEQLRELGSELELVRGAEHTINLQDSDRKMMAEAIKTAALAVADCATPVEVMRLDEATKARLRAIAAKISGGEAALSEEEHELWETRRPRAMIRLCGITRLKAQLEGLEAQIDALAVPDEVDMAHKALVGPVASRADEGTGEAVGGTASVSPGADASAGPADRVPRWEGTAALVPFGGFELLRDQRSEHGFRGEKMQGSTQMFVDVSNTVEKASHWSEVAKIIVDCAQRCEALLGRSSSCSQSLVYHQVLALVEHTFLHVLPVPDPVQVQKKMATGKSAPSQGGGADGGGGDGGGRDRSASGPTAGSRGGDSTGDGGQLRPGQKVMIKAVSVTEARRLAQNHGGWNSDMESCLGMKGVVRSVESHDGRLLPDDCVVVELNNGQSFAWNTAMVVEDPATRPIAPSAPTPPTGLPPTAPPPMPPAPSSTSTPSAAGDNSLRVGMSVKALPSITSQAVPDEFVGKSGTLTDVADAPHSVKVDFGDGRQWACRALDLQRLGSAPAPGGSTVGAGGANATGDGTGADGGGDGGDEDEEGVAVEGPYTPRGTVHVRTQRDCLRALNDTLRMYVAAAKTMWSEDYCETEPMRATTAGCIFAVFDAVLRLQALPAPLPLSVFVAGLADLKEAPEFRPTRPGQRPPPPEPVHFSTSLKDFRRETSFQHAIQGSVLASHPPLLTTRCRLMEYIDWLEMEKHADETIGWESRNLKLFEWECADHGVERYNFEMARPELLLLESLMVEHGLSDLEMPTPGGTRPLKLAQEPIEATCAWMADDWTNNGITAPEFAQLRDVSFLVKMMIADPYELRESTSADGGTSWLKTFPVYSSSLSPSWVVTSGTKLCLRWGPSQEMVKLDRPAALGSERRSLADVTKAPFNVRCRSRQKNVNEDDVVHHIPPLPSFGSKLAEEDSERLATYLTVPYMNIPLVLSLFKRENIGALLDAELQCLLEWVLFETGDFTPQIHAAEAITQVPIEHDEEKKLLATRWGRLMHELLVAPVPVLRAIRTMLHTACYIAAAEYTSTYVPLVLWLSRTASRVATLAQHVQQDAAMEDFYKGSEEERDVTEARFEIYATGGRRSYYAPLKTAPRFEINGREEEFVGGDQWGRGAGDGFNVCVVDAQTLDTLDKRNFDVVGDHEAQELALITYLEDLHADRIPQVQKRRENETTDVFVLLAVNNDGAGAEGLSKPLARTLNTVLGSRLREGCVRAWRMGALCMQASACVPVRKPTPCCCAVPTRAQHGQHIRRAAQPQRCRTHRRQRAQGADGLCAGEQVAARSGGGGAQREAAVRAPMQEVGGGARGGASATGTAIRGRRPRRGVHGGPLEPTVAAGQGDQALVTDLAGL